MKKAQPRELRPEFVNDLRTGKLKPLLNIVKADRSLMLCIRDNYLNIYYQGGSVMKVETKNGDYTITFNTGYFRGAEHSVNLPKGALKDKSKEYGEYISIVKNVDDMQLWIDCLPHLKHAMDMHFSENEKAERMYQQVVCRENNRSRISNSTSYFIVDLEYSVPLPERTEGGTQRQAKIDMIAVKWPSGARSGKMIGDGCKENTVHLAFIEMKYGDSALKNDAGIEKHLKDMNTIKDDYETICESAEKQLNTLNELGLIKHANPNCKFKVVCGEKPEYILLLANSNPKSSILKSKEVADVCNKYANDTETPFALKVFVANYAGYGFFDECIIDWNDFAVK